MNKRKITGEYIAGFVDGEGCFSLALRKDKGKYLYWKTQFAIILRNDDREVLDQIKNFFGCGSITYSNDEVRYQVADNDLLMGVIIPFFDSYKLIGKKSADFDLWKESVIIIDRNKKRSVNYLKGIKGFVKNKWNDKDMRRLSEIRNEMQVIKSGGKSRKFKY